MSNTARELAAASSRTAAPRNAALAEFANRPQLQSAVARVGSGSMNDTTEDLARRTVLASTVPPLSDAESRALTALFATRRGAGDSTVLGWEIWSRDGTRRFGTGALDGRDSVMLASTAARVIAHDSISRSSLFAVGQQMHVWTAVPITIGGRTMGVLAERRRPGGSLQTEALLTRLTGQDAKLFITSAGAQEWASVIGRPVDPIVPATELARATDAGAIRVRSANGEGLYIAAATVAGTPWRIVITQKESAIMTRPAELLRTLLIVGALLVAAGTFGAWWLTHRETRPLGTLRAATDAMTQGDYAQIVTPAGAEETAALAEAFNSMSMRISGVHATLAEQNAQLQEANEAKARFLAVMSHELRTPLNAIGGYTDLIALGVHGPVTDAQLDSLARVRRSKDQLLHLVGDILHYARLEATPLNVSHEPVMLQDQFTLLRDTMSEQFRRKGVAVACADTKAAVWGDPARVQQVLINLTTNALHFTEPGGSVTLWVDTDGDATTVHVRDTGVGIAAEQQSIIFEPFVQADNSLTRRVGGTGLGLAIVRQLTTAMGGSVRVQSVVGEGSTFSVTLPTAIQPRVSVVGTGVSRTTPPLGSTTIHSIARKP